MLKVLIFATLLGQVALIMWSANLILTGGTEVPGFHVGLIFANACFAVVNVRNLLVF